MSKFSPHHQSKSKTINRREFIKFMSLATGSLPLIIDQFKGLSAQDEKIKVYKVMNGDCFQNAAKICDMIDLSSYIDATDVVVIKGNGQWPNQGYTHTGVIKGVIDKILELPGFSGEILICDNVQLYSHSENIGFNASPEKRIHNWPDHNWDSLAAEYQNNGKPVATKKWLCMDHDITSPADGEGWIRDFFSFHGLDTYISYPIFESPLTTGRMIDMKNGVWENDAYTGRKVKAIFMPTLNNHGWGSEDYAGITSAIKSFFGATEIHGGTGGYFKGHANVHTSTYSREHADYAGEIAARFIKTMYQPVLYITPAIWVGHDSRTGDAVETKTVLACENPVTLDYIASKDVLSPHAPFLDPDQDNNTRKQIIGCLAGGIGTIDPAQYEVIEYDFDNPSALVSPSDSGLPVGFQLKQNHPNPFNPSTRIEFSLPVPERVKIDIYNLLGKKVKTILNQMVKAGVHQIEFNARNLPSGTYFYRMHAGTFQEVKRMVLLK